MDDKERVLTLASASRMTGVEQKKLQSMIDEGRLEAVKTEGGNLLISESSLKLILEESQIVETSHSENTLSEDVKKLLSQAAFFIERQESELKTYKERERKQISLLEGAEVHINKFLDQLNELQKQVPKMHLQVTTEAVGRYSPDVMRKLAYEVVPPGISIGIREMIPSRMPTSDDIKLYQNLTEAGTKIQHICYSPEDVDLLSDLLDRSKISKNGTWCKTWLCYFTRRSPC